MDMSGMQMSSLDLKSQTDIQGKKDGDLSILKSPVQNIVPLKDTKKVPKGGPLIDLRFKVIINYCFNLPWQSSLFMRFQSYYKKILCTVKIDSFISSEQCNRSTTLRIFLYGTLQCCEVEHTDSYIGPSDCIVYFLIYVIHVKRYKGGKIHHCISDFLLCTYINF